MYDYHPKVGERLVRIFYCHGCQSCWETPRAEGKEERRVWKPGHILGIEDVTEGEGPFKVGEATLKLISNQHKGELG